MIAAGEAVLYRHRPLVLDLPSPDAELLSVCTQLNRQQAEWQRLWVLTSDGPELLTQADKALNDYYEDVWPGFSGCLAERLISLRASTVEGMIAKAVAILAMDDAGGYFTICRNDAWDIAHSLVEDVAGAQRRPVGEDA